MKSIINRIHSCTDQWFSKLGYAIAVVTVLESHTLRSSRASEPPILIGDSQGRLDPGRTVIGIKHARERVRRKQIDDCARQLDRQRMSEPKERRVGDAIELTTHRFINMRVVVAVDVCPNR